MIDFINYIFVGLIFVGAIVWITILFLRIRMDICPRCGSRLVDFHAYHGWGTGPYCINCKWPYKRNY